MCVSGGGRTALTRAAASLGHVNLGHFLPDYTAYEELLDIFKAFTAIPILLEGDRGYAFSADDLRREILGRGLSALLLSNPCNPTGKLVDGDELERWVAIARELDCTLLLDEFYSHYVYRSATRRAAGRDRRALRRGRRPRSGPASSTASPRTGATPAGASPGRSARARSSTRWPRPARSSTAAAPSRCSARRSRCSPTDHVVKETRAIQDVFRKKRDRMLAGLERLGVRFDRVPDGTFYAWGNVADLPPPLDDSLLARL